MPPRSAHALDAWYRCRMEVVRASTSRRYPRYRSDFHGQDPRKGSYWTAHNGLIASSIHAFHRASSTILDRVNSRTRRVPRRPTSYVFPSIDGRSDRTCGACANRIADTLISADECATFWHRRPDRAALGWQRPAFRPFGLRICECQCGGCGWTATRIGVGDLG